MPPAAHLVESILAAAVEIDSEAQRREYVEEACAGDPELRRRVEELVENHFRAGSFLESPAVSRPATTDEVPAGAGRPDTVIGPYKLLEPVGEGGFGIVWMAQQEQPVRRKVAVKVIKPGMDSAQVVARFEAERQALALMDHPHIARVFDGGETPSGRPYFVMELVRGVPITEFCDQNRLGVRERLGLFVSVCRAVQHAHQKGIIHRDIKPSNVLVTLHDGVPVPKVIDFGIAKATGQPLTEKTVFTQFAQMIGTPLYMSPEQAEMSGLDVDTRSDVYSLGVLLYELLTGSTPLDKDRLRQAGFDEIRRIIREEEPPKPSTRMSTVDQAATTASGKRGSDPKRLSRMFRGELDWIVMRALEKDRNRRYESASAFASDVERYLHDEPVLACPPSASYRLRKFVRRNKGLVLGASLFVLSLVAGIVGTTAGLVRALAAERRAVTERDEKEEARRQTRQALNTLTDAVVEDLLGRQVQVTDQHREFLKKVLAYHAAFASARADDPEGRHSRAEGYFRVGRIRSSLDEFKEAESAFREALALQKELAAEFPDRPEFRQELATTCNYLGSALSATGRPKEAEAAYSEALAVDRQLAADFPDRPEFREQLGKDYWNVGVLLRNTGRPKEAEASYREALALFRRLAADFPGRPEFREGLAETHYNLGEVLSAGHRPKEAEGAYREALALRERIRVDFPKRVKSHEDLLLNHIRLAVMLNGAGRPKEAEGAYREALAVGKRLVAEFPSRPELRVGVAYCYQNLGVLLGQLRRPGEAEAAFREAVVLFRRLAADFPSRPECRTGLALAQNSMATLLRGTRRLKEAEDAYREALALHKELAAEFPKRTEHRQSLTHLHVDLGELLCDTRRPKEAEDAYREAVAVGKKLAAEFPARAEFRYDLARSHLHLGDLLKANRRPGEAESAYREALALFKRLAAEDPTEPSYRRGLAVTHTNLGNVFWPDRREEAAAEYREAIRAHEGHAEAHYRLGNVLFPGRLDEAIAEYRKAIRLDRHHAQAHNNLGNSLALKGKLDEAMAEYREAIRLNKHLPQPHHNLGRALQEKGRLGEAIAEYREALRLEKDNAAAKEELRQAEELARLEKRLPAVLQGKDKPNDAAECLGFAALCQPPYRKQYAAAARLFGEAFAKQPALADDPQTGTRYNAACAAALAGCGQGTDAQTFREAERARLRRRALDWLRADLEGWGRLLDKEPGKAPLVAGSLQHWLEDPDFAGVRGPEALARLPEAERRSWRKLWDDVARMRARAGGKTTPGKKEGAK